MRNVLRFLKIVLVLAGVSAYLTLGWVAGLVALCIWTISFAFMWRRTRLAYEDFARCPRGHLVPLWGTATCRVCGATTEGSVWECGHCNAIHGWVACSELTCGLAVPNPMLRR